jgi:hypothetical protein
MCVWILWCISVVCWLDEKTQRLEKHWPSEILRISFIAILIRPWIIISLTLINNLTNSQVYYPHHNPFSAMICLSPSYSLCLSTSLLSAHPFPFHIKDMSVQEKVSLNKFNKCCFSHLYGYLYENMTPQGVFIKLNFICNSPMGPVSYITLCWKGLPGTNTPA